MKNIVYIIYNPYQNPSAAYNRILLFQKGLQKLSIKVKVDLLTPSYRFPKFFNSLFKVLILLFYYFKYFLNSNNIIIIYGENYLWHLIPLYRKAIVVVERNEFPNCIIDPCSKTDCKILNLIYNCDGFITCSKALKQYYSDYLGIRNHIHISPVIVDLSLFNQKYAREQCITYCGDWGNNKDGVDILIRAFSIFQKRYPSYKLRLIGGSTEEVENNLHELAKHLRVESSIEYVGRIQHHSMPYYLCTSSILALARPNNKQAEGGFPSKIAEYLATGIPVVVTDVGELSTYLKDGTNCYMSAPNSHEAFAEKLIQAASDPNSQCVGNNGQKDVMQFNYDIQANVLLNYIQTL